MDLNIKLNQPTKESELKTLKELEGLLQTSLLRTKASGYKIEKELSFAWQDRRKIRTSNIPILTDTITPLTEKLSLCREKVFYLERRIWEIQIKIIGS